MLVQFVEAIDLHPIQRVGWIVRTSHMRYQKRWRLGENTLGAQTRQRVVADTEPRHAGIEMKRIGSRGLIDCRVRVPDRHLIRVANDWP